MDTEKEGAHVGYNVSYSADCNASIALGETKTCTVTNDDQAATLIVIKHAINDNGGTATAANFTMSVAGGSPSPASFAGEESPGRSVTLNAGSYSVSESGPSGYSESDSADCAGSIANGETKTCTITNNDGKNTPAVATTMKWTLKNNVTVSNLRPNATDAGDAYVIFTLYGPFDPNDPVNDAPNCDSKLIFTSPQADGHLTYNAQGTSGTASTNGSEVPGPGIYLWQAHYSGDNFNDFRDTICGSEKTEIKDLSPSQ